jgi:hypothetical protein
MQRPGLKRPFDKLAIPRTASGIRRKPEVETGKIEKCAGDPAPRTALAAVSPASDQVQSRWIKVNQGSFPTGAARPTRQAFGSTEGAPGNKNAGLSPC